ncbi:Man1-Src1p-C-terminal domain-containing protein [Microdochium trichocladiopsis]|uniref:Man1-Src1p-C-terminal domain-containing protein n=1 Tax=Microdochium trichocladiopsis TaxID=1682393 RepID=A0A9P9BWH6_9PEZI|nr:Man1-Src1p-C-terminal domain-containing protein [Microdochium trichocladiopsis]KAH7035086.1 Man1-Src1p-C-terminal domain-containing protein [Microdochium trichocladiopsis]
MSDSESVEYLQPGFDPKTLTIPRLRSILVAHNIPYSSSAKKGQLIEIFNEEVVPRSKKILADRARAKRSSKGIVDAGGSQSSVNPFDDYDDLPPPTSRASTLRRSKSPRKAAVPVVKSEEPEYDGQPMLSPAKARRPRQTSRQPQPEEPEPAPEPAPEPVPEPSYGTARRRVRQTSGAPPQIKSEETDEGFFRRESGAFSRENPFQSASSPPSAEKAPLVRRKTPSAETPRAVSGASVKRAPRASSANVVRTPPPVEQHYDTPEPEYAEDEMGYLEPGEEFTPEEQLELAAEEALHGERSLAPVRRSTTKSSGPGWGTPISVVLVTALAAYAGWFRQEKIAVGYCGVGQTVSSIPNEIEVPEWAHAVLPPVLNVPDFVIESVEPQCEPCPAHAYCYADYSVRCEQDYILKLHPFSLGGIIPLPPTCEPDGEKVRRVQTVADKAVEELRERTAKFECGELVNEEGAKVETPAIEEQELKGIINQKRSKKMSNQEFEDLWAAALGEITQREEVVVETQEARDSGGVSTRLSSTSLARVPLTCAVKRSIRLGLARHRLKISAVIALALTVLYARARFLSERAANAQVPALVDVVLDRLAAQKQAVIEEGYLGEESTEDPWLFLPNLRDDVLRSIHSLSKRERLWQRVIKWVEQNSNVRTGQREGRNGEVGRAWEWIGPVAGAIEGGSGVGGGGGPGSALARRRRSQRYSYGAVSNAGSESAVKSEQDHTGTPEAAADRSLIHRKWDEGSGSSRPIY